MKLSDEEARTILSAVGLDENKPHQSRSRGFKKFTISAVKNRKSRAKGIIKSWLQSGKIQCATAVNLKLKAPDLIEALGLSELVEKSVTSTPYEARRSITPEVDFSTECLNELDADTELAANFGIVDAGTSDHEGMFFLLI